MSNLGHTLRLSGAHGQVRQVLEITQLQIVLEHHDDVGDAVEAALSSTTSPADPVDHPSGAWRGLIGTRR
jgi:hypothetical protein